ncbi:hypothetical protein DET48_12819 [Vibrio diazotrophicus]|jgi:serine transporter|uniref:Serine transporter n=1 Tax=Vibrio diazotrophicus TaxID=685 RepID=A0A329E667_VIBDI|nr:hypothetical protein DET48_12819 [Vibrio diazotrophicus]
MNTSIAIEKSEQSSNKWTYQDFAWTLSLFGTAVGAGVLFLPIKAGAGGFWPLVILALLRFDESDSHTHQSLSY